MSSIITRKYRSTNAKNPKGGYQKTSIIITRIPYHINGHYVRPNKVVFKHLNFKKYVDSDAHVKVFNFIVKANAKTSKKYIINEFSYTLRYTTSDWCHNYMLDFPDCIFLEFTHAFCKCH
jgi:hypothetical protein